jgi:hypothetical protein
MAPPRNSIPMPTYAYGNQLEFYHSVSRGCQAQLGYKGAFGNTVQIGTTIPLMEQFIQLHHY